MRRPALILVLLGAGACANPAETISVQGVKVTPQVVQLLAVGDTARVHAAIAPANATDQVVSWESTDSTVASVSASGLVTAVANGAGVFITAYSHDGHHQASVNVTVGP